MQQFLYHFSTPLHYAAGNGHLDIVKMLVENGASTEIEDHLGDDPLEYAVNNGWVDISNYLESA